jgi:2-oxoglutarate ferredoxin oxidoreductase subunit alpha
METLMAERPWDSTGMVVLQAESEIASIHMVYGASGCGKRVMTSSSSPGISLMAEGISYMAGSELPCVIVNVQRGGPGLGTIQPSQADYNQATKGGGHGDYSLLVLAPASVQEMHDFVVLGFELAFKYRNPVMILADGVIGQLMEKVELIDQRPRWTNEQLKEISGNWATSGKLKNRKKHVITSLEMDSVTMERNNLRLQEKYNQMKAEDIRFEAIECEDAEYILVAFGSAARICQKTVQIARKKGVKVGLIRPITLFPFPEKVIAEYATKVKGFLSVEFNAGQMVNDIRLAVGGKTKVEYFGRMGGIVPTPDEVEAALEQKLIGG